MANNATITPQGRLRRLLETERDALWVAVAYSAAIGIFTLALPVATQALVNTIAMGNLMQPLIVLSLLVFATLVASGALQLGRFYAVEHLQRRVFVRVASGTIHRLVRARINAFDSHHGPELVNRFFDVVTLQKAGASLLVDGLSVAMQTGIGMILLAVYHPWLLGFCLVLLAAIVIVVFPLGSGAVATSIGESRAKYGLVAWLEETARFPLSFRPARSRQYALDRADALVGQYLDQRVRHFRVLVRQKTGTLAVHALAGSALLGLGGWLVIQRQLTLGQLVAAEIVVQLVLSAFVKLTKHLEMYYDLVAAVDKLGYLEDLPLETGGSFRLEAGRPAGVRLRGVRFGDSGAVDWEVRPGEQVGLLGPSGSGRSTLLDLIAGYREPASGVVEIDGHNVGELDRTVLRDKVALIRAPEVFAGTVLENLCVPAGASGGEVRGVLERVGLLAAVTALPSGLNTPLATGGAPLSQLQTAQLVVARALFGGPRLLILDETLDRPVGGAGFERLLDTVFDPAAPWTLIVATSRQEILSRCGTIVNAPVAEGVQ